MIILLGLMAALIVKHFVCDFLYQPPYQWKNKGTYGHWGGIVHSAQHAVATMLILAFSVPISPVLLSSIVVGEFLAHYHMDWFKMWYNAKKGWRAETHPQFWMLLGVDQLVHYLTYVTILLTLVLFI